MSANEPMPDFKRVFGHDAALFREMAELRWLPWVSIKYQLAVTRPKRRASARARFSAA
jgi:hypothetical protein